ncbi:MAG: DNA methyltransferase [Chloroflexi bacterium]|nr:DNA methyltransferase [Chloroflexota bacterium]
MTSALEQLSLPTVGLARTHQSNSLANRVEPEDRRFHDWYRFVLSFPPHLVRRYIDDFGLDDSDVLIDPFCGTGTTLVEAKARRIPSVGLEANPVAQFATSVKVDWEIDPDELIACARVVADETLRLLRRQGINDDEPFHEAIKVPLRSLDAKAHRLLIKDSISPVPLHKALVLLDLLKEHQHESYYRHALLAFASALVYSISNLRFGPEVGIGKVKQDSPVVAPWLAQVHRIAADLRSVGGQTFSRSDVLLTDAREISHLVAPRSVSAVITSPPYPNEKDYTRTTRLESVLLGFIHTRADLRAFKQQLIRSNTRTVFKDDSDDEWIKGHAEIQRIADSIEARRVELGKTSGFERQYCKVTLLYFGGMARHLAELRSLLRPGAQLAYVVGDQASYFRVMIRTGQLLADIAREQGYQVVRTDLFRTRFATATKEQLREEVVVLRWPG